MKTGTEDRKLIEKKPIAAFAIALGQRVEAARELHDDRVAAVLGEIRQDLVNAIADAERPPAEGMSAHEEAAREGVTVWTIWKRRQRAKKQESAA